MFATVFICTMNLINYYDYYYYEQGTAITYIIRVSDEAVN